MPESDTAAEQLEFIPLHFGTKLKVINPHARLGILTLWSKTDYVERVLTENGVDLSSDTSNVAVIGNLYGNGIPHLLRNLLYNPQIRDLAICGANRSGSREELCAFFDCGLEQTTSLGEEVTCVKGTNRLIDDMVCPDCFAEKPRVRLFGDLRTDESRREIAHYVARFKPTPMLTTDRIKTDLPEASVTHFPSEPRNHNIVKDKPLEAWRELVFRLTRFGHLVHLRKGDRQELQNVRAVIKTPEVDDPAELAQFGISLGDLLQYQHDMLIGPLPDDQSYTYGNRIREYYGFDALHKFGVRLRENPEDRDCYLALWDSHSDIDADDAPCLVSMFFRKFEDKLTLTATYRTHNALDAWLKNIYGLIRAQQIVADEAGMAVGPVTVISHSISVDPSKYDVATRIANAKAFTLDMDPSGQFLISVENGQIVVQHLDGFGQMLNEYRSRNAERLQHELNRDCAISDINHAIYVGRQLARAQICLESGADFVQE